MSNKKFTQVPIDDLKLKITDYVSNGSFKSLAENVKYQKTGYARLIRLVDYNNNFDIANSVWVDKKAYEFLKKTTLKGGEIIINNVGEYAGTVFLAPKLDYPTTLAPNAILLKTNQNDLFYYYYFQSSIGYNQIRSIVSPSGQPKFNKTDFKKLLVPKPERPVQDSIANFLIRIDTKIANNKKLCLELEGLAKTLFNFWFLQFEFPNKDGMPYKLSKGKMVYNKLLKREIPFGWEVVELGTIIKENEKSTVQVNKVNNLGVFPFFTSGEDVLQCSRKIVSGLNLYLSTGGNATVKIYNGDAAYSTDTWCITAGEKTLFCYEFLMTIKNQIQNNYFNGSGLKHLNKKAFKKILLCVPKNNELIPKFNSILMPFFHKISSIMLENKELISLRDFLLPLFMTGQITIEGN